MKLGRLQREILARAERGEVRVAALARELETTDAAVSHALRRLHERGFLRRPSGWKITPDGRRLVAGIGVEQQAAA